MGGISLSALLHVPLAVWDVTVKPDLAFLLVDSRSASPNDVSGSTALHVAGGGVV